MKTLLGDFYVNMQIDDFECGKPVNFSNPNCWPEYEAELKARGLEYILVKGLYSHGINWAIIRPEEMERYRGRLFREIERKEETLALHREGLRELEAEMKRREGSKTLRIFPMHARVGPEGQE